jgi:hypothetical protein
MITEDTSETVLKIMVDRIVPELTKEYFGSDSELEQEDIQILEPLKHHLTNYIIESAGDTTIEELQHRIYHFVDGYRACLVNKGFVPN